MKVVELSKLNTLLLVLCYGISLQILTISTVIRETYNYVGVDYLADRKLRPH